jgi:hypothetical protein
MLGISLGSLAVFGAGEPPLPNVVFILADDLGINDLSCYGRKDQPTPILDKLARQGLRFTSAYSAATVCSPSRAAILTGRRPKIVAGKVLNAYKKRVGANRAAVVAPCDDAAK